MNELVAVCTNPYEKLWGDVVNAVGVQSYPTAYIKTEYDVSWRTAQPVQNIMIENVLEGICNE